MLSSRCVQTSIQTKVFFWARNCGQLQGLQIWSKFYILTKLLRVRPWNKCAKIIVKKRKRKIKLWVKQLNFGLLWRKQQVICNSFWRSSLLVSETLKQSAGPPQRYNEVELTKVQSWSKPRPPWQSHVPTLCSELLMMFLQSQGICNARKGKKTINLEDYMHIQITLTTSL